jgi:TadE-like protein
MVGRRSRTAQAMVEFALVAPILLLILLILIDFGRGLFYYGQMAAGAREGARQATLEFNDASNYGPTQAGSDLPILGVIPQINKLTAFGYGTVYELSASTDAPPSYGTVTRSAYWDASNSGRCVPAQISLSPKAEINVLYIFVYQLDPQKACAMTWDTKKLELSQVRTGGHALVVVDLKMKWAPTALQYAGLGGANLVFDAQSAQREEW